MPCYTVPHGKLPVRYLGVPLISTKLTKRDCAELTKKISNRIQSWNSKFLSYAGRAQLIQTVLYGIQNYWASMFVLPKGVLKDIDKLLRNFLWTGGTDNSYGSKVAWENVCQDKKKGGLGFKNTVNLNNVLALKHIWSLFQPSAQSLWVQWVHTYRLKGKSFWVVKPPSTCSWAWRKLLRLRDLARQMLSHRVGNGEHTFLWYDNWHSLGPLVEKFGTRVIYDSALPRNSRVSTVILNNSWAWPVRPSRIANSGALMAIRGWADTNPYSWKFPG